MQGLFEATTEHARGKLFNVGGLWASLEYVMSQLHKNIKQRQQQ